MNCIALSQCFISYENARHVLAKSSVRVGKTLLSALESPRKGYSSCCGTAGTPFRLFLVRDASWGRVTRCRRTNQGRSNLGDGGYRYFQDSSESSIAPVYPSKGMEKVISFSDIAKVFTVLQNVVDLVDPGKQLYLLGSTAMFGVVEVGSDVDCVAINKVERIKTKHGSRGGGVCEKDTQKEELSFLDAMHAKLEGFSPGWKVYVKPSPVPVLRLRYARERMEVVERRPADGACRDAIASRLPMVDIDITSCRVQSLRCTYLLRRYLMQHPFARWLCLAIKAWGKQVGLHTKCKGSSSIAVIKSHGFILMVIYYFLRRGKMEYIPPQAIDVESILPLPPALPPIVPFFDELGDEEKAFLATGIKNSSTVLDMFGVRANASVKEYQQQLWHDFFLFYRSEFDAEKECIAIDGPSCGSLASSVSRVSPCGRKHSLQFPKQLKAALPPEYNAAFPWSILDPITIGVNLGEKMTKEGVKKLRETLMEDALKHKPLPELHL